ncbi:MAG: hypothetical protein JWN62_4640 [Acidimicrobiales bacterium]|jgi:uncharacterized OB-fold protein|nr:hypothetical protein [Acidimicrobiales bacterium]
MSNTIESAARPIPVPSDLTRPYWDAAKEHRLDIQRCQECSYFIHVPLLRCPRCDSAALAYEPVSGNGTIYSYTSVHDTRVKSFQAIGPFIVAHVELVEQLGLKITCNLSGTDPADVKIGAPVEVIFLPIGEGMVLPDFKLATLAETGGTHD